METTAALKSNQVIVIDAEGKNLGRMNYYDARDLATAQDLDLVKVGTQSDMSVMRIMDEGKWKYTQKKKQKSKYQKTPPLKEMKFHINTDDHDVQTKIGHIDKFLSKGSPVKISVEMKGRFKNHSKSAHEMLQSIVGKVSVSVRQDPVRSSPSVVSMIIHPG